MTEWVMEKLALVVMGILIQIVSGVLIVIWFDWKLLLVFFLWQWGINLQAGKGGQK